MKKNIPSKNFDFDEIRNRILFYRHNFNEGCEIEDGVTAILDSIDILLGLELKFEVSTLLLVAEKIMTDYMRMGWKRELDWDAYQDIDPDLYAYLLYGAKKLTEQEYHDET